MRQSYRVPRGEALCSEARDNLPRTLVREQILLPRTACGPGELVMLAVRQRRTRVAQGEFPKTVGISPFMD